MAERVSFHLDEHISPLVAAALRKLGVAVSTSQEQHLLGESDRSQLAFALKHKRVFVTFDADFLKRPPATGEHCGIVYCGPECRTISALVHSLHLVHEIISPEEMQNHIEYL